MKMEIEEKESKLNGLANKWGADSALKGLSKHDHPTAVRALGE